MYPIYILIISIDDDSIVKVGSLGKIRFQRGYYIYIGSGGRSLFKRVSRHFKKYKVERWHIDYLTNIYRPIEAYRLLNCRDEYEASEYLLKEGLKYIPRFGSTDKRSKSHLFYIKDIDELDSVKNKLNNKFKLERIVI